MKLTQTIPLALTLAAALLATAFASAQTPELPDAPQSRAVAPAPVTLRDLPRNFWVDQKAIWTSPRHLNSSQAAVPVLLAVAVAVLATTDHQMMTSKVPTNPTLNQHAVTASNGMLGSLMIAPVALYGLGRLRGNQHAAETGILAGEAMVDSLLVGEVGKLIARRERPDEDNSRGRFFQTAAGTNAAFPSNHATIAWASASAIASEYHGTLPFLASYGLAAGVSATRVLGRKHFPADALAGSAIGWMIGRYVIHRHRRWVDNEYGEY